MHAKQKCVYTYTANTLLLDTTSPIQLTTTGMGTVVSYENLDDS